MNREEKKEREILERNNNLVEDSATIRLDTTCILNCRNTSFVVPSLNRRRDEPDRKINGVMVDNKKIKGIRLIRREEITGVAEKSTAKSI